MTDFDVSQLCIHYEIHELEQLCFPVVEMGFAAPYLPNEMESGDRTDGFFDHIFFKNNSNILQSSMKISSVARSLGMNLSI